MAFVTLYLEMPHWIQPSLISTAINVIFFSKSSQPGTELILNNMLFISGKNVVHQLSVTLEDLYNGATRKLALQKNVICDKCEGMLKQ